MSSENVSQSELSEPKSLAYAWGVAVCLSLGYALSFLDRELLSLVINPVKESFELTDFQVSLLMGPAFAIFLNIAKSSKATSFSVVLIALINS